MYQCNCCGMCHWIANIDQCLSRVLLFLLLSVKSTNANSDRGGMAGVSIVSIHSLYLKVMSFTLDGHCNNGEREGVKSPYSQNSHWMVVGWPLNRNGWFYQTHATGPQLVKSWNVIIIKCVLWNWRFVLYSMQQCQSRITNLQQITNKKPPHEARPHFFQLYLMNIIR